MKYYTIAPPKHLAEYVRFYWVLESDEPYCHLSTADGCAEMVFHYQGIFDEVTKEKTEKSFSSGLHGPSQFHRRFIIRERFGIFGVYLYPFAIPNLFSLPGYELSNQTPDLVSLFGAEGRELEERIMLAGNNLHRATIVSSFLEQKLLKSKNCLPGVCKVINHIIHSKGQITVDELAKKSFLSIRQFERRFKYFAGFSPKLYSRIIRFQSATQFYGSNLKSLTKIAYDCGYYDQSHFIADFKLFSGCHPGQYFHGKAEGLEWRNAMD